MSDSLLRGISLNNSILLINSKFLVLGSPSDLPLRTYFHKRAKKITIVFSNPGSALVRSPSAGTSLFAMW